MQKLKRQIADLTSWYPDKEKRDKFSEYLKKIFPSWIITTNYDLVIESLLTGTAVPLGPNDPLVAPTKLIPVFHLHGIRTSPEEIIIAQDDYVGLFRPTQYRQVKLALMIKESTMLILGYGLGDVNVLTALDWSKNVFKNESQAAYPNQIIQVIRKEKPKEAPYKDRNSILVLETESLESFFEEYIEIREEQLKKENELEADLEALAKELDTPKSSMVDRFIDDHTYREQALKVLSRFSNDLISGFISFLNTCIDVTWERSAPKGAFQGYADNLNMILDILTAFTFKQMPPALFETIAYALHRVGRYVGRQPGQSFAANEIWQARKSELSHELSLELLNFAEQHNYNSLKRLISQTQEVNENTGQPTPLL